MEANNQINPIDDANRTDIPDVLKYRKVCTSCGVIKTPDKMPSTRTGKCKDCWNSKRRKAVEPKVCKVCSVLLTPDNTRTGRLCKPCYNLQCKNSRLAKLQKH